MEAGNLGAWLAVHDDDNLEWAVDRLARCPYYRDDGYLDRGLEVRDRCPDGAESLAIPTWFYGHEPSNLFSTHVAKYFSNSLREDGLLAIATALAGCASSGSKDASRAEAAGVPGGARKPCSTSTRTSSELRRSSTVV